MKAYFVTGTDTGVGKTTVSRAILAAASAAGLRVGCMKPAESGCARGRDGELIPEDARALLGVSNMGQTLKEVCLYCLEAPVAPGVAAAQEGVEIDFGPIKAAYEKLVAGGPDVVLVEGAGGLLVPMGGGRMVADLVKELAIPLLIVARPGLGTINHTLLSIAAAQARGIEVAGFVFSACAADEVQPLMRSNVQEIMRASGMEWFGCLRFLDDLSDKELMVEAAMAGLKLERLLSPARGEVFHVKQ